MFSMKWQLTHLQRVSVNAGPGVPQSLLRAHFFVIYLLVYPHYAT